MRRQTARPLRACAALLALYVGARVGLGAVYPEYDIVGLKPFGPLAPQPPANPAVAAITTVDRAKQAVVTFAQNVTTALVPPTSAQERYSVSLDIPPSPRSRRAGGGRVEQIADNAATPNRPMPAAPPAAARQNFGSPPSAPISPVSPNAGPTTVAAVVTTPPAFPERRSRFSGSAWLLVRQGSGAPLLASGGTLGGSQAGVRLNWQPFTFPVFFTVRASGALAQRDSEIAPGVGIRGRSVGVIIEQRFRLEKGRSSQPALVAYGGFSDKALPGGVKADGYAQAGAVGVSNPKLFADGAFRLERNVASAQRFSLGLGGGVWAAAQPGASRVDVGPQIVAHVPIGKTAARLSAEYRVRLAGAANPGSGVVVTLGADF